MYNTPRLVGFGGKVALTVNLTPPPTLGSPILSEVMRNFEVLVAYENGSVITYYNIDKNGVKLTAQTTESAIHYLLIIGVLISAVFFVFYTTDIQVGKESYEKGLSFQVIK